MQSLLKWSLAPILAAGLLLADSQSANAQFGISIGIGGPVVRTSSFGYGYGGINRYGGVNHYGYAPRSSLYSPYSIGVPAVRYQSFARPSVHTQYYSPRRSYYPVSRSPAVIVPRARYGSRRCF